MANHKWADVAHYYLASKIELSGGFYIREYNLNTPLKTWRIDRDVPQRDSGIYFDDWSFMEPSGIKPILRHLEDMTEGEARELWEIGFDEGIEIVSDYKTQFLYGDDDPQTNNIQSVVGNPHVWNRLLAMGFDMFMLIESGQAIRKGVEGAS